MGKSLKLLSEYKLRDWNLKNRIFLAPMTRGRATNDAVPTDIMTEYYKQRAGAGLIITEGTGISRRGLGWHYAPGIWNDEQVEGWKKVTKAVHDEGGVILLQLWHMGRQGHSDVYETQPVSASAIAIKGEVTARDGEKKEYEVPKAMTVEEIRETVKEYGHATENAMKAGFDGVEIHGANGYLVDQFLQSKTNQRTDDYGGSVENRLRFLKEVVEEILGKVPASKVAVRFSPNGAFGDMGSEDNIETFTAALNYVASKQLAMVDFMDGLGFGFHKLTEPFTLEMARAIIEKANPDAENKTSLSGNVGYTLETAEEQIEKGNGDLIGFGRPYISNPDLVERFKEGVELAPIAEYPDWWGIGKHENGYTTFKTYKEQEAAK